jgi:Fe(3+) dicitrate transport protein
MGSFGRGAAILILFAVGCASGPPVRQVGPAPRADELPEQGGAVEKPKEAPEILVTGEQYDEVPFVPLDAIGSRDVFGPERVRDTAAREINELVQHIPAISTRPYNGGEAAAPSFSMRGLPDDGLTEYIDVLIDGVPASPLPYGWTAFSFFPVTPDRLWAVDYIRGAHQVRYSPNTVGGVLNFVTRPIPTEPSLTTRLTVGDNDYVSALAEMGGPITDRTSLLGSYVNRKGSGYRDEGEFDQQDASVKFKHRIDAESWIAAAASWMEDGHKAPGGLTRTDFDVDRFGNARPDNRFDGHREVADVVYHKDSGEGHLEGYTQFSHTKRHLQAQRPQFGAPTTFLDWTDDSYFWAIGARGEQNFELAGMDNTVYAGARFHTEWLPHYRIDSMPFGGGPSTTTRDSEFTLNTLSLHVDDTIRPTEHLAIQAGVRLEWIPTAEGSDDVIPFDFEEEFFRALPGVGASYEFADKAAVFANWFQGFRAPQVWGYGSVPPTAQQLELEDGTSAELGVRTRDLHGVSAGATLWRIEFDDFGVFYTGFYENLGRIVSDGVDLEASWHVGEVWEEVRGLVVGGSVTFQDAELRSGPNAGNEVPYAWETKAAWYVRYTRSGWVAFLGGTYVGESFSDDANTAVESADGTLGINPSRVVWDARLSRRIDLSEDTMIDLAVGATNLFDQEWYVHSRGGFFGGGLVAGAPVQAYASAELSVNW